MLYKHPILNCLKPLESYIVTLSFTISNELCVTLGSKHLLRTAQILVSGSVFCYQKSQSCDYPTHTDEAMNCLVQNILNLTHKPAERLPEAISLKPVSMSQPTHGDGDSVDSDTSGTATTTEKKPFFRNCSCQNQQSS